MEKTLEALKWIIHIFEKHNINYQITGGFAAKLYGSVRPLNDIDFEIQEKSFPIVLPEISKYVTFGPARFKNDKWDIELIILNYCGQNIDICGYETARMSSKDRTKWISNEDDPMKSRVVKFEGLKLKVICPSDLIEYKKELDGIHQLQDIKAVSEFMKNYEPAQDASIW